MGYSQRATEVLGKAEERLREILSEATMAGDYASVVQVAAWARLVSEMLKNARGQVAVPSNTVLRAQERREPATESRPSARRREGTDYPRFFRQGDRLVRVAWSRRDKTEYEHRAPYAVLEALATVMAERGADGRVFSTEQLLPLVHAGDEVPSYQVYVALALLKQAGLVDQHGRRGYSIPRIAQFESAMKAVWQRLPRR